MKFGVSIDKQGELEITDRKLERFKPILESCITVCINKYYLGLKYPSREWNIYEDPDFLKILEKVLDSALEFLIKFDIFPEDILDERETRKVEGRVFRSQDSRFYMVGFPVDYRAALCIPTTNVLLEAVNNLRIRTWSLISCEGCMCCVNLGLIQGRKIMSKKSAIELFDNLVNGPRNINFQTPIYKKDLEDIIDTGITVTLDTERLGKYIPLRYILETRNK